MSITVNVTGITGFGYAGAYDLLLLESDDFLLWEDGGQILTSAGSEVQGQFDATGVGGAGLVGTAQTIYGARVPVAGIEGVGLVGTVFMWDDVNDAQDPNWVPVNDSSSPGWTNILLR